MKNYFVIVVVLFLSACSLQTQNVTESNRELVFHGKVSLTLNKNPHKLFLLDGPTLITESPAEISYGIIDQKTVEFIGYKSSPFEFITSVFSNNRGEIEENFYEPFKKYSLTKHTDKNFYIYELTSPDDRYVYITSPKVSFIIEIFSKSPGEISIQDISKNVKLIKQGE